MREIPSAFQQLLKLRFVHRFIRHMSLIQAMILGDNSVLWALTVNYTKLKILIHLLVVGVKMRERQISLVVKILLVTPMMGQLVAQEELVVNNLKL